MIAILSLLSLPAALNAVMMIGTRTVYAMGRDRLVWARAAEVTDRGAPGPAMMLTALVAIGLVTTGTFQRLGGVAACFLMLDCAICGLAVFVLRRREGAPGGFRAWGYPWTPVRAER